MSRVTDPAARGAFFYFDCLRFVAALLVVAEHWRDLTWLTHDEARGASRLYAPVYALTGLGAEAVWMFFVLSGFWITATVERRIGERRFWAGYLVDRLTRLLIVVAPALVLGGVLDGIGRFGLDAPLYRGLGGAVTIPGDIAPRLSAATFAGNLLFLQTIAVPTFGSNGPLWSLANEFWYYLWFPALLLAWRARRPTWGLPTLAVAFAAPALLPGFAVWLLGSALYYADRRAGPRARLARWTLVPAAAAAALAIAASRAHRLPEPIAPLVVGLGFASLAWTLLRCDPPRRKLLAPIARFGARASFSLYVVHFPLLALAAAVLLPGGRRFPSLAALAALLLGIAAAVAFARVFAYASETRTAALRRWSRRRLRLLRDRPA